MVRLNPYLNPYRPRVARSGCCVTPVAPASTLRITLAGALLYRGIAVQTRYVRNDAAAPASPLRLLRPPKDHIESPHRLGLKRRQGVSVPIERDVDLLCPSISLTILGFVPAAS